jgi:hypothetical protein
MALCPLCNLRKAKRSCPAVGSQICTVCCGTKRIVEISCPPDCGYLVASRTHPPAIVQRQHELDRAMMLPLLQGLSERQARIFLSLAAVTARHQGDALQRPVDDDIQQAAGALAATLETSTRGIVYEHRPASLAAARLMGELKALVEDTAKNQGSAVERDAAIALRRIEHAAKTVVTVKPNANELQEMFKRVLGPSFATGEQTESQDAQAPSVIIP